MTETSWIFDYLKDHGGIYTDCVVLLKSRKVSNIYIDARILNATDESGEYLHKQFLQRVGLLIGLEARELDADMLVGVIKTGATLATFGGDASTTPIDVCYFNPHDEGAEPDCDVSGRKVLIVDDTTTTGGSIADTVVACEKCGATVVGALTLVRRDPAKVGAEQCGMDPDTQKFISLLDLDIPIIVEEPWSDEDGLLRSGLPVRLDIGYAATDGWPEKYPDLSYVGNPVIK
jgi:orotate phosphoribosyltransferase